MIINLIFHWNTESIAMEMPTDLHDTCSGTSNSTQNNYGVTIYEVNLFLKNKTENLLHR